MLKDQLIAVTPNNGSHFTTLKMMEGFLDPKHLKVANVGTMPQRLQALKDGKVAAVSLMEPWISVAQKQGLRILIESHSTRAEAAGDELDGETLKKMFRAQARAVEVLEKDPSPFIKYFVAETGGLIEERDFQSVAPAERAADGVHARALRGRVQLDGEVEHDRAGRDLREHGGQPRLGMSDKVTIEALQRMKADGRKIVGVVAWDYQVAQIADRAGVDIVSVGDSVGTNLWGRPDPTEVTLDEMVIVCKAVRRGVKRALVSCDFPYGPRRTGIAAALAAAKRLVEEGGADMVKVDAAATSPMRCALS
jgi:hypothetical protein